MLIKSKILRPGGTKVVLDGKEYHFKPLEDGPEDEHVCDVTNAAHKAKLLSIKEGFSIHTQKTEAQKKEAEAIKKAAEAKEKADDDDGLDHLPRAKLDAKFKELFDREPNARAKDEAVIQKIREKMVEAAAESQEPQAPAKPKKAAKPKAAKPSAPADPKANDKTDSTTPTPAAG